MWTLEHALFGFTQMNTAHDGVRLGQALYKITARLGVVHKVVSVSLSLSVQLILLSFEDWPYNM